MTGAGQSSVLFEVGGRIYAVASERVHGIVEPPVVAAVPFAPAHVEGVVAIGGTILPLVDLASWAGAAALRSGSGWTTSQVVVLDSLAGQVAVRVTRVVAFVPESSLGDPAAPAWSGRPVMRFGYDAIDLGRRELLEDDGLPDAVGETAEAEAPAERLTEPFVVVGVGHERYALPIGSVREIAPLLGYAGGELFGMPGAPMPVLGLTYLRGAPLAVLSLAVHLGRPARNDGVLIVLLRENGKFALLADQVLGVRRFVESRVRAEGYLDDDDTVVLPLDAATLIPDSVPWRFQSGSEAAAMPAAQATPMRQLVTFEAAGETCALPVEEVERAVEYRLPTRVPRTGAGIAEAIEVGGAVVPIIDLRAQLRPTREAGAPGACLVTRIGKNGYALAIDRLDRLASVPLAAIETIIGDDGPITGLGRLAGRPFWMLSARRLVARAGVAL
ncbi:MAG: chemotaxis protein CheW [Proteobacteria bacterium]|nr:chemotaxis protein CheW [Pseudomonadota bacterium]MBI3499831.1 chemotaxis protein CheW [Pseudomonadota bacterium]